MTNHFDSVERLKTFENQLIQLHGTTDNVVPLQHARRLYDSIPSTRKTFVEVPGMGHNDAIPSENLEAVGEMIGGGV